MNQVRRYGLKTVTTWARARRLRLGCLVAGILAALAMVVVGCTSITSGTATFDAADAPEYRASVASSIAASESERQVAVTKAAVHTSCDALGSSSGASVEAVNAYVDAYNRDAPDAPGKVGPAIDALNGSADQVSGSLSAPLSPDLTRALNGWVDSARQLAGILSRNPGPDEFNAAIRQLNDSKTAAGAACDAAY
ncbi:MAG: hypothetical protein JHC64_22795 [Mycolicibacterium sp.]|nr:hypothetical protein [Mycolicibacterium sp.]